jgi:hypothetical protein
VAPATVPPSQPERVFVAENVTLNYLAHLGDGLLGHQVDALHQQFVGKWMNVSGGVGNVQRLASPSGPWRVVLPGELHDAQAFLWFSEKWEGRLTGLAKGSVIRAIGEIESIDQAVGTFGPGYVSLKNCELVD